MGLRVEGESGSDPTPEQIAAMCEQIRAENEVLHQRAAKRTEATEQRSRAKLLKASASKAMAKIRRANKRRAQQ